MGLQSRRRKKQKRLQRIAKNKKKTLQKNPQSKRRRHIKLAVKFQGKMMDKKKNDSLSSSNDDYVRLDVIDHSKVNNVIQVRHVSSEAFVERSFPAHKTEYAIPKKSLDKQVVKSDTVSNQADMNSESLINKIKIDATLLLRDDESDDMELHAEDDSRKLEGSTICLANTETACEVTEPDDDLSMQLQKLQDADMDQHAEDDSCISDESTLCLANTQSACKVAEPDGDHEDANMELYAGDDSPTLDENIITLKDIENSESEFKDSIESTENINNILDEFNATLKKSPGLRMITPEVKAKAKLLKKSFCTNLCNYSNEKHLKQYQRIIFDSHYLRPEQYLVTVNAIRGFYGVSVIFYFMVNETRRLISLHYHAEIYSEHPILMRLARDGFFSDESGLVSCFFCGQMIQTCLFLSSYHNQLVNLLDNHCNHCARTNNTPMASYGSHVRMNEGFHLCAPSGCQYLDRRRHFCHVARWIHDNMNMNSRIVPSGMHLSQQPQGSLPQPELTYSAAAPQIVNQVVTCTNVPAQPSSDGQQAVASPTNAPAVSSTISEVEPASRPAASSLNNVSLPSQFMGIAERDSRLPGEEVNEEQIPDEKIAEPPVQTGEDGEDLNGDETVRAELARCLVQDDNNTRVDIVREMPSPHSEVIDNMSVMKSQRAHISVIPNPNTDVPSRDNFEPHEATIRITVPRMADFVDRISTYQHCDNNQFNQTPQELAANGLYYTGNGDRVCCCSCGGCLEKWKESDIPILEHTRHFPECDFNWHIILEMQMDDPLMQRVIGAFVRSEELSAVRDRYTYIQICNAVQRLIYDKERVTYASVVAKLHDMNQTA